MDMVYTSGICERSIPVFTDQDVVELLYETLGRDIAMYVQDIVDQRDELQRRVQF